MSAQRSGMKLSYLGSDADEVADVLSRCIGPVNVQRPRKGDLSYRYEFVGAGSVAFSRATCEGTLSIGQKSEAPKLLIMLPLSGSARVDTGKESFYSGPGTGAVHDGNKLSQLRIDGSRSHFSLVIGQDDVMHHLANVLERPVYGSLDFAPEFSLDDGRGQIIFRLAQIMAKCLGSNAEIRDTPQTLKYLSQTFINLLIETVPHRFSDALTQGEWLPSPRHVKRAIDFMHANLPKPLSMTEIAEAAGTGVRSLQEGFKRFKGTSPTGYLTQLRMEAAHRDLMTEDPAISVSDIARKWGFRHMGRFSNDYRRSYGHPPSQTRKQKTRP